MSRRIDWNGYFVVCVTPFRQDGGLDEAATREMVDLFIAEGVDGIVVAGSTGEWFSMSDKERIELFRIVADQTKSRVKLIAGVCAIATPTAVHLTESAKALGYDGALILPPPYVLPSARETEAFFAAVDAVGLPLMLYNNPARTGVNLDAKTLRALMRFTNVVALKESVKDLQQVSSTVRAVGAELAIFTGLENYLIPMMQRGAVGVVAMSPNVLGKDSFAFFDAIRKGDFTSAIRGQKQVDLLYDAMYGAGFNPYVVLKEGMRLLGRPGGFPREPLLGLDELGREKLSATLKEIAAVR